MDDNVHLQHSMALGKELVRQGIMFKQQVSCTLRLMYCNKTKRKTTKSCNDKLILNTCKLYIVQVYPDASHSLSTVREHFYLSMGDFLKYECFGNSFNATDAGRWL